MATPTIPRPSPLDKLYRLHTPSWRTTPPSCVSCGAPIRTLEAWLDSECPGERGQEAA